MGGCLSKKTKEDPNTCLLGSKLQQADVASSRDPPPTESPPRIEEEKVKEVLSETPTCRFVRAAKSNPPAAKVENGLEMEESDLCCSRSSSRRSQVATSTPSESISAAASISLISGNTRAAPDDDEDEEEGETVETMKKKTTMKIRSASSSSSAGIPRSQSPAAAGKREFRGVDVAGPSPSPLIRAREMGNHMRIDHINSSSSYHQSNSNNNGNDRVVVAGERCGRSVSPATSSLKSRSSSSATKILSSDQLQAQRRSRHCRSLSSSSCTAAANGRFSPQSQRIPAAARARRQGRDGNFNAGSSTGGDGTALLKEESLENPLVSMECFIFL